jgi:hypothetical protein
VEFRNLVETNGYMSTTQHNSDTQVLTGATPSGIVHTIDLEDIPVPQSHTGLPSNVTVHWHLDSLVAGAAVVSFVSGVIQINGWKTTP